MEDDRMDYNPETRMVIVSGPGRPRIRYRARGNRPVILSQKRRDNLQKAFDLVEWDFDNATLHNYGIWGDRQQWNIPGRLYGLRVRYRHQSPGGGKATIMVLAENGMVSLGVYDGALVRAAKTQRAILRNLGPRPSINVTIRRK